MGDRSSIIIRQHSCDDKGIEIYGHWAGTQIIRELPRALKVAKARWHDQLLIRQADKFAIKTRLQLS